MRAVTHPQARARHLARQARSDALRDLREGHEVWITVPDLDARCLVRARVVPVPDEVTFFSCDPKVLCLVERRLQAAIVVQMNGLRVVGSGRRLNYRIHWRYIFGWVRETHPIKRTS